MPHQIRGRGKPVYPVNRHIFKGPPVCTSRHNRFRGMIGRGRGRQGTGLRAVVGHGTNVWRLADSVPTAREPHKTMHHASNTMPLQDKEDVLLTAVEQAKVAAKGKGKAHEGEGSTGLNRMGLDHDQTKNKRKNSLPLQIHSRPIQMAKRSVQPAAQVQAQPGPKAQANLNPDGFYEIHIEQEHGQAIADICGVTTVDVFQSIAKDNDDRRDAHNSEPNAPMDEEMEELNNRFDPDTEDELDSGEE